jgi:ABC-type phosphate transport system substrate-binding protein
MRALSVALVFSLLSPMRGGVPPFVAIVNESNPVTAITKARLSQIFLKRLRTWDDGAPIEPVDLEEGSAVRTAFSKAVHDRSTAAIKAYWEEQVFSGAESPPVEMASETDVITYVRSHVRAIGYVSPSAVAGVTGVRVVEIAGL